MAWPWPTAGPRDGRCDLPALVANLFYAGCRQRCPHCPPQGRWHGRGLQLEREMVGATSRRWSQTRPTQAAAGGVHPFLLRSDGTAVASSWIERWSVRPSGPGRRPDLRRLPPEVPTPSSSGAMARPWPPAGLRDGRCDLLALGAYLNYAGCRRRCPRSPPRDRWRGRGLQLD